MLKYRPFGNIKYFSGFGNIDSGGPILSLLFAFILYTMVKKVL